jgi:hypothetical protein
MRFLHENRETIGVGTVDARVLPVQVQSRSYLATKRSRRSALTSLGPMGRVKRLIFLPASVAARAVSHWVTFQHFQTVDFSQYSAAVVAASPLTASPTIRGSNC